jgi:hypothetical protein
MLRNILGGLALALSVSLAHAASLVVLPRQLVVDADGDPRSGAKLYTYVSGTTTPLTSYTTPALSTAHANPVVAVSTGLIPAVYFPDSVTSYKLVLKDSSDVTIWTEDNIPAGISGPYPQTANETAAGVTAVDLDYPEGHTKRYGAVCDAVANDTAEIQMAIDVASENGGTATIQAGVCLVDTLTIDSREIVIEGEGLGSTLKASTNIPASGAIILSLSGDDDTTVNQALLDGVYGADVYSVRTADSGSLEDVKIRNLAFMPNAVAVRAIWMTGFTRGCVIENSSFDDFDGAAIVLNGSWSFSLIGNRIEGDGTNGSGIELGVIGNGENSETLGVNAALIVGNTINNHANGIIWNFGSGLTFSGNTVELNTNDGFSSHSGNGATIVGNYFEGNDGDNMQIGGTNGTDFFEGCQIIGNHFATNSGSNINLRGTERCKIGPNYFSGDVTQHYFIASSGSIGQYVTENEIWVPALSGTYISNDTQLDVSDNFVVLTDSALYRYSAPRIHATVGLTTAAGALNGFYGVTAVDRPEAVTAPTGGGTTDAEARTAINSIIDRLEELGLVKTN